MARYNPLTETTWDQNNLFWIFDFWLSAVPFFGHKILLWKCAKLWNWKKGFHGLNFVRLCRENVHGQILFNMNYLLHHTRFMTNMTNLELWQGRKVHFYHICIDSGCTRALCVWGPSDKEALLPATFPTHCSTGPNKSQIKHGP